MKLTSRLLAAGISIAFAAAPAHATLVGHWKFDDGSGTTAIDSSTNGYDATQGAAAGGWIAGKAGGAYNLPRFKLDAADSVAVKNGGGSTVSLSVWMTVSSVTNNFQGIAGFESTGNGQDVYSLKMDNTDKIVWTVDGSSSFASADTLTNYAAATGDGWVHVVGVYEQGVGSTLYVNGAVAGTGGAANAIQTDTSTFGIGSYQGGGSWVFSGSIDDVQVYHSALDLSDVTFLNSNPGSVLGGGPATVTMGAPSANTITDDGATVECQVLNDDADLVTVVWAETDQGETDVSTWTSAPGGGSHSFGAASQDAVLSHAITGLDGDTQYSFRFFATAGADSDWSAAGSFATGLGGSPAPADLAGTPDTTTVGTKVDLTWTDSYANETGFVIQRSTDPGFGTFDEFSVGADETSFTDDTTEANTTYFYRIAAEGSSGTGPFSANVEVTTGDDPPSGLIGHWTFDDGSGTVAADSSGSGYDADVHLTEGTSAWITGKAGGAYDVPRFTLDAAESDALNLPGGSVTISVWVTEHNTAQYAGIAGFEGTGATGDIYGFKMDNADRINWTAVGGSLQTSPDTLTNYAAATADGWVHLVGTYDGTTGLSTAYVNGSPVMSATQATGIPDKTPPSLFRIGTYYNSNSYEFNGAVDDVQLYNFALAADDVTFLYNNPGSVLGATTSTFELSIAPDGGGGYNFTWESQDGKLYDLVSETDLSISVEDWPVWDGRADLPGNAPTNTLTGVAAGPDSTRFFAVVEKDLLDEGFEGNAVPGGWSAAVNSGSGTDWGVDDPSGYTGAGAGAAPPGGAGTSTYCAGTNVLADYGDLADCSLTTPALPIPAGGATLSFQQWIDTESASGGPDYGTIKVRDAGTNAELGTLNPANIEGVGSAWAPQSYSLDAYAGQTIKIEFLFVSDDSAGVNFAGWYLDDVTVTGK